MTAPYISLAPLVPWKQMPRPIDWAGVFGRNAPLELEIGCGNGEVLVRRALARPEANLVGLDHGWPSARRALRRINLAGAANARVLQAEAELALERLFVEKSLSRAWCFFPRPWPKPRHEPRRLFCNRFMRLLNSRLEPGAACLVVTDHRPYLEWALAQAKGSGLEAAWSERPPGLDSKYERKWRGQGQEVFYELTLVKKRHLPWPLPEEPSLHYPVIKGFDPARLGVFEHWGDTPVMCKDVLYDAASGRGMLRMVVLEDGLEQAFYLELLPAGGGHLLRPAPGCGVLPSLGVQLALELTAKRLGG
jgi:tRNA (guanine-N7-)-methyltransferase